MIKQSTLCLLSIFFLFISDINVLEAKASRSISRSRPSTTSHSSAKKTPLTKQEKIQIAKNNTLKENLAQQKGLMPTISRWAVGGFLGAMMLNTFYEGINLFDISFLALLYLLFVIFKSIKSKSI